MWSPMLPHCADGDVVGGRYAVADIAALVRVVGGPLCGRRHRTAQGQGPSGLAAFHKSRGGGVSWLISLGYAFAVDLNRLCHSVQVFSIYRSCKAQQSLAGCAFHLGLC